MATKREILLDFLARDRSGPATNSFGKNVKDAGEAADKAGKKAKAFGESSEKAARGADELGDQAKQTERQINGLDREITEANAKLLLLARAFAEAGDKSQRLDISRQVRQVENDIRRLEKSKGILSKFTPEIDPRSFFQKLSSGLAGAGTGVSGALGSAVGPTVGAAIAIAAAPVLAQTLGSALSGAAGAAGIGAGIALAISKDDALKDAGKRLGKKLLAGLQDEASSNYAGPLRQAFGVVEDAANRAVSKIGTIFENTASSVVPLVRDIVNGAENILDAFVKMSAESDASITGLGDAFVLISEGVADFLTIVSDGGPQAADSLRVVAGATADLLRWTGLLIDKFNEVANNPWLTGPLLPLLKSHYKEASEGANDMAGSHTPLIQQMNNAEKAARGEQNALEALSNELRAQTDPVFGLLSAQDKLKEAQDRVKESTKQHGAKSRETKAALRELASAALEMQGQAGKLGSTFSGQLTPQLRATFRAAGLTDNQIDSLGDQFMDARKKGNSFAKRYSASVKANGIDAAIGGLVGVRNAANSIPRAVTIAMRITGVTNVSKQAAAIRKQAEARASGGPVVAGAPYWVGEQGPELIIPSKDGQVLSAMQSRRFATGGRGFRDTGFERGGPSFRTRQKVELEVVGPEEIRSFMRYMIRSMNLLQG